MSSLRDLYIQYLNYVGAVVKEDKVNEFVSKANNSKQVERYLKILINDCKESHKKRIKARGV